MIYFADLVFSDLVIWFPNFCRVHMIIIISSIYNQTPKPQPQTIISIITQWLSEICFYFL